MMTSTAIVDACLLQLLTDGRATGPEWWGCEQISSGVAQLCFYSKTWYENALCCCCLRRRGWNGAIVLMEFRVVLIDWNIVRSPVLSNNVREQGGWNCIALLLAQRQQPQQLRVVHLVNLEPNLNIVDRVVVSTFIELWKSYSLLIFISWFHFKYVYILSIVHLVIYPLSHKTCNYVSYCFDTSPSTEILHYACMLVFWKINLDLIFVLYYFALGSFSPFSVGNKSAAQCACRKLNNFCLFEDSFSFVSFVWR